MEFENTFVVDAPMEEVWDLLLDVERIAPCMPGAQVLEQTGDDVYKVAVKIKLGPMTMNYKGDVEIVDKDAGSHQATMRAKAKEARGQGTASANMRMALRPAEGGTEASILTEMQMCGKAAAMGQGVIKDVAATLTDTFAQNVAKLVEAPAADAEPDTAAPQPPPVEEPPSLDAGKIAASVASQRLREPRTVAALVLLFLLILLAVGRRGR